MNPLEHELHYPFQDTLPAPGTALEVAPGIKWLRMPLPFALDHINLWLLRDELDGVAGWTIVDCGVARDEVKALWERIFAGELQGLPVLRVIVTHMHPDHIGLAHWLTTRWKVPMLVSMTDFAIAHLSLGGESMAGGGKVADHFARNGMTDPQALDGVRARAGYYAKLVPSVPPQFTRLVDGQTVRIGGRDWQVIVGRGHAPEHVSLFCREAKVVISGDMVLPRISTNVAVNSHEPDGNPLQDYLDSLDRYAHLPDDVLILPSHGKPFTGLHTRIRQQHEHHADHLGKVLKACAEGPKSGIDIVPVLFKRELDLHQTTFALGEAIAHLHVLWHQGKLVRRVGDDGIWRFSAAG